MRRTAFSLIELLVVISIIAVLAGMLLPAVKLAKISAQTAQCARNLGQIALAADVYVQDWDGLVCPAWGYGASQSPQTDFWHTLLADYVEVSAADDKNAAKTHNVLRGCPEYTAHYNGLWYNNGYGWTTFLRWPMPAKTNGLFVNGNGNLDSTGGGVDNALGQVRSKSDRPMAADCYGFRLWVANYAANQPWWREGLERHQGQANVLFFDGHVERRNYADVRTAQLLP